VFEDTLLSDGHYFGEKTTHYRNKSEITTYRNNNETTIERWFLLDDSPAFEFYMPTFRRRGITQKKAYNIQDTAKV